MLTNQATICRAHANMRAVVRALSAFLSCSLLTTTVFTRVFIEHINDDDDNLQLAGFINTNTVLSAPTEKKYYRLHLKAEFVHRVTVT